MWALSCISICFAVYFMVVKGSASVFYLCHIHFCVEWHDVDESKIIKRKIFWKKLPLLGLYLFKCKIFWAVDYDTTHAILLRQVEDVILPSVQNPTAVKPSQHLAATGNHTHRDPVNARSKIQVVPANPDITASQRQPRTNMRRPAAKSVSLCRLAARADILEIRPQKIRIFLRFRHCRPR